MKKIIVMLLILTTLMSLSGCSFTKKKSAEEQTGLVFSTTDIDGNPVSNEMFKDAKLVVLNFWEPWCGPCVSEMPALQKLYENYKDKGVLVIGVYASFDQDRDVRDLIKSKNITYPIIRYTDTFNSLQTGYIPTTYFLDNKGNILNTEAFVGGRIYIEWESLIEDYLR